jgi:hypothetical protein
VQGPKPREVDNLGGVGASCDFYGGRVTSYPFLRSLFAIVLGDPNWLEALRVLVTVEPCYECWKAINAVGTFWIGYFTLSATGINYGWCIASFIDFLA